MNGVSTTMTMIRQTFRSIRARIAIPIAAGLGLGLGLGFAASPRGDAAQPPEAAEAQPNRGAHALSGKTNRLARETSPYLLLHARNPVDWHPWGPEAFAKAKAEDKPIFLSIGYSSCYWCHVMERECFMNEEIAKALNNHFICVKVDREERPDIDQIYMTALQAMGRGGWPLSMFLTPDGRPFFGGTYFPPKDREGMTGFPRIMQLVVGAWREKRKDIDASADAYARLVRQSIGNSANLTLAPGLNSKGAGKVELTRALAAGGRFHLSGEFDPAYGGFGYDSENPKRPKFPEPSNLLYLLDQHRRDQTGRPKAKPAVSLLALETPQNRDPLEMTLMTLDHMARGGIRDQLAGGYHRYSVGRFWIVPHFEKMLYDNAQMAAVLVEAFEFTGDERWRREGQSVLNFLDRVMTTEEGGFMSALDAEAQAVEGKTYVWTRDEARALLAGGKEDDYRIFAQVYGLMREPNFEDGQYVLLEPRPREEQAQTLGIEVEELEVRLEPLRRKLLQARDRRPAPLKDDKVLASWNGLAIAAYADAARVFKDESRRKTAERAADLVLSKLRTSDGRLLRSYRAGQAKLPAYLEDYAFVIHGLLRLHHASGDAKRLTQAKELADRMIADFRDPAGGFFYTANNHEPLLARSKDPQDGVLPSGNSLAVRDLIALSKLTGEAKYADEARKTLEVFAGWLNQHPGGAPMMLIGLEEYLDWRPSSSSPTADPSGGRPRPSYVQGQATIAADAKVVPGGRIEAKLALRIKEGWHIYANPAGSAQILPTTIGLGEGSKAKIVKTDYPKGQTLTSSATGVDPVAVYEKDAVVTLTLELGQDVRPGDLELAVEVRYQACDQMACLAPATLTIPLKLTVAEK